MHGALTIQKFKADEDARLVGQIEMRTRIAKWMRETAERCRADRDVRAFAKMYDGMAAEIETLEPR